jgi:uncharacterized caspase-like protein
MAKVALLIGVSEYEPGLDPLPGAIRDIKAMQQVLQHREMGGFDEVKTLTNPNSLLMQETLEVLLASLTENDLILLFFSGHSVKDDSGTLHFATRDTGKTSTGELVKSNAVSASFIHDLMSNSSCKHQVIILECCFSSAFAPGITAKADTSVDIKAQLSRRGRALLTSFTSTQYSSSQRGSELSVYTRYLVEGIETGAADLDGDSWIAVNELHEYASRKVQEAAPAMKPEFYFLKEENKILLAKAQTNDPKLKYRKEAERRVSRGEISPSGRYILNSLAWGLGLTSEERANIEAEVLKPYQEYQEKLQRYRRVFMQALQRCYPLNAQAREELTCLQQFLGLRDEDVIPIEEESVPKLANNSQSEDKANELTQSRQGSQANWVPSTPSAISPVYIPNQSVQLTNPPFPVNSSSGLAESQTSPTSVSRFPNKFLLWLGIGGGLAALALVIGIFTRPPKSPLAKSENTELSSLNPSPMQSPTATNPSKKSSATTPPSPNPTASPKREGCSAVVSGNLRSEPAPFRDNIVKSVFREQLPVTGKQTKGGWMEVKLPNNTLAWVHREVVLDEEEIDSCLFGKGETIKLVPDIEPPEPSPSPEAEQ